MRIQNITVIGAGAPGRSLAQAAAAAGFAVVLHAILPSSLRRAEAEIEGELDRELAAAHLNREECRAIRSRIEFADSLDTAVAAADLVVETVPEEMESKLEILLNLDKMAPRAAIIACNLAVLSISELALSVYRPEACLGVHLQTPFPATKLLELTRGVKTNDATVQAVSLFGRRLGKQVVVLNDRPGRVQERVEALLANEAAAMLADGVAAAADIDTCFRLGLRHPHGPLEQMDRDGIEVRLQTLERLAAALGERFRPHPLLREYVEQGRTGKRAGRGFYTYGQE